MKYSPAERRIALIALLVLFNAIVLQRAAQAQTTATSTPAVTALAAARFLEQAGFGPTAASVAQVQQMGFSGWIDSQIALPQSKWSAIPDAAFDSNNNPYLTPAQEAFFVNTRNGQDQLRQRVALALSEIWVVSLQKLQPQAIVPYLRLLQADGFTTYDKIMNDVTLSPAMGHYLDMVNNAKGASPNENYAREVMQLFTIGLNQLDTYGRVVTDSKGVPVPAYTQETIEGFSAVFTGWTYAPATGATSKFGNPANWTAPMVAFENYHDRNPKTLLNGQTLAANQTAEVDLKEALNNIFEHSNVGPFISRQLIQRLVTSSPSDNYVHRITAVFNQSPRGNIAAVVKAILLDPEARQGDNGTENAATKLREPALWISAFLRGLNATVALSEPATTSPYVASKTYGDLPSRAAALGQSLYNPPTVFDYFHPGYDIAISSTQSYNAPEFELLSEATAAEAADVVNTLVYGTVPGVTIDLTPYITPLGAKPTATQIGTMVDSLNNALMGGRMPAAMKQAIVTAATAQTSPKAMVQTAVYLIGSSWNYQVER